MIIYGGVTFRKLLVALTCPVLLLLTPTMALAQTSAEMDAEADKLASEIVARDMAVAKDELLSGRSSGTANRLLIVDPYNTELLSYYSADLVNAGPFVRLDFATAIYLRLIKGDPGNWVHHANFGSFLDYQGYPAEADRHYARALELNPTMKLHFWRGAAAFKARDYANCVASLDRAEQMPPEPGFQAWTYAYLGLCHAQLGHRAEAAANLKQGISLGGDDVASHMLVRSGAWAQPVRCDKDTYRAGKRYRDTEGKSPEKRYVALVQWASCFPDDKAAMQAGQEVTRDDPRLDDWWRFYSARESGRRAPDVVDTEGEARFYLQETLPYMNRLLVGREFEKALQHTLRIPLVLPDQPEHFYVRALMFLEMPEYRLLAWREARHLLRLNANSPSARAIRARVYYEVKGNPQMALAEIAEGFRHVVPERTPDLHFARGRVYYGEGQYAQALAEFEAALKVNPNYPQAAFYRDLAANPQVDTGAALAARDSDTVIRNQLDAIATAVNIAMSWFRHNGDRAQNKAQACEAARKAIGELSAEQGKLRQLAPGIPAGGALRDYYDQIAAGISGNLNTVAGASGSCG